uniref:Uncharacterized protein n=1 Tax=Arundo donax TaxID=35708 RepID=A0A0A9FN50_ARUDO
MLPPLPLKVRSLGEPLTTPAQCDPLFAMADDRSAR